MNDGGPIVRLNHVSQEFDDSQGGAALRVLDDISVEVNEGELLTIVGPSGCGKTTLLKLIAGFATPTEGTLSVDGARVQNRLATIPQASTLLPWRTLLQNACLGLELRDSIDKTSLRFINGLIEQYGLKGFEDYLPGKLSGGMRQRVAVIRALASKPMLLLCDEPFSSVDFVTRLQLSTVFRGMCLVRRITTVFVTHNIEEAIFLGTRIVVMSGRPGRIVNVHAPIPYPGCEDAVRCREAAEFGRLFHDIWGELRSRHDG